MAINEVFRNPTVKQIIFQIRFPNLFYIEKKIGDFQVKIMKEFPESALLTRRQVIFADIGPQQKLEDLPINKEEDFGQKIWQFKSGKDYQLNVLTNSLDITSQYHKTYNLGDKDKFRDIIEFCIGAFIEITSIPIINRIGLRYIDECPIGSKTNKSFKSYYNSTFPLDRFSIADAREMEFKTVVNKNKFALRYIEALRKINNEYKLILDFDGFAENIEVKDYLATTDALHDLISNEYEKTIKEPVYKYMKKAK